MRENVATTVLSKDDRPLPPRTNLTVEAAYTRLSHDAVKLGLLRVLTTEVADLSFSIVGDKTRLLWRHRTTSLEREREREEGRKKRETERERRQEEFNELVLQLIYMSISSPSCVLTSQVSDDFGGGCISEGNDASEALLSGREGG